RRLRLAALAGDRGDVRGDVLGVLARDEVLRHRRRRLADLVEHDVLEGALLEPLLARACECVVEVRPERPRRPGRGERVTPAALLGEDLLAGLLVGVRRRLAAGAAACEKGEDAEQREDFPHYAGGALPVVPSLDTASSRVG